VSAILHGVTGMNGVVVLPMSDSADRPFPEVDGTVQFRSGMSVAAAAVAPARTSAGNRTEKVR
jgi:hypothetical protein